MAYKAPISAGRPSGIRISLWKLRLGMIGTIAAITAIATLVLMAVLSWLGLPFFGIYGILGFVAFFHLLQWLIGPYIINALYHVRALPESEEPWLHESLSRISRDSGLASKPKLMMAEIDIPNAFAYGSPMTGNRVAVTRGLLSSLTKEEVEAVVGHEVGHLKHRDVLVMMMISIIPALIYYMGYMLYTSGWFGGWYGYSGRRNGGGAALLLLVGIGLIVTSFILNIFVYYMSRLREYYADSHAALVARDGARNLQRALVRIMRGTGRLGRQRAIKYDQLKAFFISDPDTVVEAYGRDIDAAVEEIKRQKPSVFLELFSTHPHPAKRLRHLDRFIGVTGRP